MSMQIIPLHQDHLQQAGVLLAKQQERNRQSLPELPPRFEDAGIACQALAALLKRRHAQGFASVDGDRVVAYLIGEMVIDNVWGRSAWVRTPGCAYAADVGVEIIRDLYAALGEIWVSYGIFFHFVLIPVSDPALIQAWFSLSFGIEQIHALIDLQALSPVMPAFPPGVEIRKAGKKDGPQLAGMSDVIWKTQVQAPVWGVMLPETVAENVKGWSELVEDADITVWLASVAGNVVATQGYWPVAPTDDNLLVPENCVHMSVAGTHPEVRGQGISTVLTAYGLAQAQAAGYRFCEADWRSTNLPASRFWPHRGFRPMVYRLVRRIDPRIVWADGTT